MSGTIGIDDVEDGDEDTGASGADEAAVVKDDNGVIATEVSFLSVWSDERNSSKVTAMPEAAFIASK